MELIIPANVIPTLLVTAGSRDIRSYLNALCIYKAKDVQALVSTDGHRATVYDLHPQLDSAPGGRWLLPRDFLDKIKFAKAGNVGITIADGTITLRHAGAAYSHPVVDLGISPVEMLLDRFLGKNLHKLDPDAKHAYLNPYYVADAQKQMNLLTGKKALHPAFIYQGTNEPVIVSYAQERWVGVIMPMRGFSQLDAINGQFFKPLPKAQGGAE